MNNAATLSPDEAVSNPGLYSYNIHRLQSVAGAQSCDKCAYSGTLALLFDESLILIVWSDPNPNEVGAILHCECSVVWSGPH